MKHNTIIDESTARTLLARWYDATATAEEEDALTAYFAEATDIPEDLQADAAIFALPTNKADKMSEAIPAGLMAEVNGAIIAEKARARRHGAWYAAIGMAACICVALVIGLSGNTDLRSNSEKAYAVVVQKPTQSAQPEEAQSQNAPAVDEAAEIPATAIATTATVPAKPHYASAPKAKAYNDYREVTDPEEAERIQFQVAQMLAKTVDSSDKATSQALRQAGRIAKESAAENAEAISRILSNSISNL